VKSHLSTRLEVTNLVFAGGGVGVDIEELGGGSSVLWEHGVVAALVPFLIVVNHVVALRLEQRVDLFVREDGVEQCNLIDGGFSALISDAGGGDGGEESGVDFPDESLVEHHEGEGSPADHDSSPGVVGAVQARVDLVEVVRSSHAPFSEVARK